jgi:hypothetical protein
MCVAAVLVTIAAVNAVGAGAIACGIAPMYGVKGWTVAAWVLGMFVGTRMLTKGKDGAWSRMFLLVVPVFAVTCLIALLASDGDGVKGAALVLGAASLLGGALALMLQPKKKRRVRMKQKGTVSRGKKR